jgi:Bacteriophage replication gene A protein (GPA)
MVAQAAIASQFVGFDGQLYSYSALDAFGTHDCAPFRQRILARCGALANAMRAEYLFLAKTQSHVKANLRFLELDTYLNINTLHLLCSHEELTEFADSRANLCTSIAENHVDQSECFKELSELVASYSLAAPEVETDGSNLEANINRLCCPKWWRRQLRKLQADRVEAVARELRQVNAFSSPYCSVISLAKKRQQKQANRDYLESRTAVNELNQEFTLAELSALSVSNPSIRRLELITRCKGFEAIAKAEGHEGVFITLTAPSRFHRMIKITNGDKVIKIIPNKTYAGLTPRDAQEYLSSVWARIQAKLSRNKIKPYGFRIAEPHHDGTPHWHFLLFSSAANIQNIIGIFQEYALKDSPDEKGAKEHRLKIELIKKGINEKTGQEYSATGYLIKYICKNIDGYGVDNRQTKGTEDWANKNAFEVAEKIEAWSRTHRIRQFQQIGGASVTVWRELRRLSEQEGVVEQIRQAADAGDWAAFVQAMGGATVARKDQALRPAYAVADRFDKNTGELIPVLQTQYGDEAKERVIGVLVAGVVVLSRIHYWEIKETENLRAARQKIMEGIAEVLEEIHTQNTQVHPAVIQRAPRQRGALDLCQ